MDKTERALRNEFLCVEGQGGPALDRIGGVALAVLPTTGYYPIVSTRDFAFIKFILHLV
jgi:hypothetical protein